MCAAGKTVFIAARDVIALKIGEAFLKDNLAAERVVQSIQTGFVIIKVPGELACTLNGSIINSITHLIAGAGLHAICSTIK